jgi:hypothetical protein
MDNFKTCVDGNIKMGIKETWRGHKWCGSRYEPVTDS